MGLKYPKRLSESVVFRENFINQDYVEDNGGVLSNSPTIDNGITITSNELATYSGAFFDNYTDITIEVWFTPDIAYNEDSLRYLVDTTANLNYTIYRDTAGNNSALALYLGGTYIGAISGAVYGSYWVENGLNHLVATSNGTTTSMYLNGNLIMDEDATAWTPSSVTEWEIGGRSAGSFPWSGVINKVSVYNTKWTAEEVSDAFQEDAFREIANSETLVNLPLRSYYIDGSGDAVTKNTGSIGGTVLLGDGTTAATFPTQRVPQGMIFDGVDDYLTIPDNAALSFGDSSTDSAFSACMMINLSDITSSGFFRKMVDGSTGEYTFGTNPSGTLYSVYIDETTANAYIGRTAGSYAVYQNRWTYLAFTYDGSSASSGCKIYANGERIDNGNNSAGSYTAMHATAADVEVGKFISTYTGGTILRPQIFNFELTQTQINELMNQALNNLNI